MSEPDDEVQGHLSQSSVDYPRSIGCPKCHEPLDPEGWCSACAKRRILKWSVASAILSPPVGFGMCAPFFRMTPPEPTVFENAMMFFGSLLCCAGPFVALIGGAVAYGAANRRAAKEESQ